MLQDTENSFVQSKLELLEQAKIETFQACVLSGYVGATRGLSRENTLDLVVNSLRESEVLEFSDIGLIADRIETGYVLHFNDPNLSDEDVVDCALGTHLLLYSDGWDA